jgi:transketolase
LEDGIRARVIDCYSIKPIDSDRLIVAAAATNGRVLVAEDHHPEGGLGSAVKDTLLDGTPRDLRVVHLAVRGMPGSGTGPQLLGWAGIDAEHIAAAARQLLSND